MTREFLTAPSAASAPSPAAAAAATAVAAAAATARIAPAPTAKPPPQPAHPLAGAFPAWDLLPATPFVRRVK
jgi:hypothetical protein